MTVPFTLKEQGFDAVDYVIFLALCILSCTGGFYYSATASKKEQVKDVGDYLLGGKRMTTFPVAMGLVASYVSGVTILGTPVEIYNHGSQYWLVTIGVCFSSLCVALVYVPVFFTLQLSSSYEYLELRFNRHVRAVASILFLLDEILFLPMVVYIPCLAFNQLTGANVLLIGAIMVVICGIYTALGGLRAVVWTDAAQTIIMFVGVLIVLFVGIYVFGGVGHIARVAKRTNRFSFDNWSLNLEVRQTGWGGVFGGFIYWTCFNSVNQTMVQRYIVLPTKKQIYYALVIFSIGALITITSVVWCGLTAWAAWEESGCHPDGAPIVGDRLLPAFVSYISTTQNIPGLRGVFLAGVFGAGLSSLSCVLNACALVVVEDLLHGWLRITMHPFREGLLARGVSAVLAVISIVMLIVVEKLGGVLGVATALSAIASSATCGIFTLGMACWWVGSRGAIAGGVAGAVVAVIITLGTQAAAAKGQDPSTIFPLFRVSYHWVCPMGLFATLFVGALVGLFNKTKRVPMDSELFTPCVHRWLPRAARENAGVTRRERQKNVAPQSKAEPSATNTLKLDKGAVKQVSKD